MPPTSSQSTATANPRRTLAFVINSLGAGGAERALANILNAAGARRERFDIHLVLLDDEPQMRVMPDWVTLHVLDGRGSLPRSVVALTRLLKRLRPALTVSLLVRANLSAALAARLAGCPVIVCERMHLSSHLEGRYAGWRLPVAKALPRLIYPLADRILGVSSEVAEDLVQTFGAPPQRTDVIYNPYDLEAVQRAAAAAPAVQLPPRYMVAVARLVAAKNVAQLVRCHLASVVETDLVILGDGPERANLQRMIQAAPGGERIHLLGFTPDPFPIVARAEAYLSASRNEGFPNAMVEAMILGLPVLVSDCRSGPSEILARTPGRVARDGLFEGAYGLLFPEDDDDALVAGLHKLSIRAARERYGALALARANDFRAEIVAERYWSTFEALAAPA
jgi:glycosyltransferase involved in cell wall biosynthesis